MGISDHLTGLLRNLYAGQEPTELDVEQQTGSKLGKECVKAVYCDSAYLTNMQSTSCESTEYIRVHPARLDEAQVGSRLPGEISITLDM